MMFGLHGLGDSTNPQGSCSLFSSWSDPLCLIFTAEGGYADSVQAPLTPAITQAYVTNSAPAVPAEAYDSGVAPGGGASAQSASDTIDGIIAQTQANAVSAANAAAAKQAAGMQPSATGACVQGSPQYNSVLCFLAQNSGMVFVIGAVLAGFAFIAPSKGRR